MPQFELEAVGPARFTGLVRGRTPEEAVREAADLLVGVEVAVLAASDAQGWQEVRINGTPAGRLRLHQRMRFRRD